MPFQPGKSGNARGRPSVGASLADAMRRRFPVDRIVELAEHLATSATVDDKVRFAALQFIADRAHGKVVTVADVTVSGGSVGSIDWAAVPSERRRALLSSLIEVEQIASTVEADDTVEH